MLRTRSGLSGSVVKWAAQVVASVGATLLATLIYSALPKVALPEAPPRTAADRSEVLSELTSGGKFAARAVRPAAPQAADGPDVVALPLVASMAIPVAFPVLPTSGSGVATSTPTVQLRQAAWDAAAPERSTRPARPSHAPARAEPKRASAEPAPRAPATVTSPSVGPASDVNDDGGFIPTVLSAARGAWSLTASAGGSLMARVMPQIP